MFYFFQSFGLVELHTDQHNHLLTRFSVAFSPDRWKNAAEDLVVCSECNASIVIQIHPNLSTSAARDVCQAIEAELAKAHALDCSFRSDAEKFLQIRSKDVNESNMVPAFIASVLTPSVLELMEHPSPQQSLRDRVMTLVEYFGLDDNDESESSNDGCKLRPVVEIPRELLQFGVSNQDNQTQDSEFLPCIKRILELPEVDVQAIALALLGWEPSLTGTASGAQVKCQVCLATADVVLEDTISPTEDGATSMESTAAAGEAVDAVANPSKRQRTSSASVMNPILSHRHYCPFVCGFPRTGSWSSRPLWKVIATRILQTNANLTDPSYRADDSEDRIHTMLKAGIASNSPNRLR